MPEQATTTLPKQTKTFSDTDRAKSKAVRQSVLSTLYEATELKRLAFETAMEMKEQFGSDDESEKSRARAQAITGLVKSWSETVNVIRIERGKPLPGSLRPESKPKKQKQASWAMVELVPKPKQLKPVSNTVAESASVPETPTVSEQSPVPPSDP